MRERLLELLRRDAFRAGRFTLASGKESDFFIDCKRVILTAEGHRLVGEVFFDALTAPEAFGDFEAVAGVALGGCPLASAVSLTSSLRNAPRNALYVRKEPKSHGTASRIEGSVPTGARVALLEDVLTTGGSSLAAVEALKAAGYMVTGVLALVDRAEGGVENLAAAGVRSRAVFHRRDFIR